MISFIFLLHLFLNYKKHTWLSLQGPTISPVFCKRDGKVTADYYAIVICVPKKALYKSIQQLRAVSFWTNMKLLFLDFLYEAGEDSGEPMGETRGNLRGKSWMDGGCLTEKSADNLVNWSWINY